MIQMKSLSILALTALITAAPLAASAHPGTPRADQREKNQAGRVVQGVKSGELTKHETKKLVKGQVHVRRVERRAKADGVVTAKERAHVEHAQDVQSKKIYRQKHDAQARK
jgi:hypothetical protein